MTARSRLKVRDIATTNVLTVTAETSLQDAIALFVEKRLSCLVVADGLHPQGIVTERDLLRLICAGYDASRPVRAVMSAPLMSARQDLDFALAWNMLSSRSVRHLVLVDEQQCLRGVVSATDFRRHIGADLYEVIQHLGVVLNRSDEMVPPETPLQSVLESMASRRLDHMIIGDAEGRPLGILTERDVPLLMARQIDARQLQVGEVMSHPLKTVPAGTGVAESARLLNESGLRHLVAVDEQGRFAGVISQHRMLERLSSALLVEERDELSRQVEIGEQRFRTFVENMQLPLCHITSDDRILYLNQRFTSLFGYQQQDIPHLAQWWQACCPDAAQRAQIIAQWREAMTASRRSGLPIKPFMQPLQTLDGRQLMVEVTGTCLGDEFLATFTDITARQQQQQLLLLQARRAQALLELPRLAEQLDVDNLLQRSQQLLAELTGSQIAFLHLLDGRQSFSCSGNDNHCADTCPMQHLLLQKDLPRPALLNQGQATALYQLPPQCPAGRQLATLPLYEDGRPVMLVGVAQRDAPYSDTELETLQLVAGELWRIIQHRRSSQALRTSETSLRETASRLQEAQRIAHLGNWEVSHDNQYMHCSAEARSILETEACEAFCCFDLLCQRVHPDERSMLEHIHRQALSSGQGYELTVRLRMQDGRIKHVHINGEARLDEQGLPQGVIGTLQDVTEQRSVELALSALATSLASLAADDFYQGVCRHLADALGLDQVFVGQFQVEQHAVQIITGWAHGKPMSTLQYSLEHTPCDNVIKRASAIYPQNVQQLFPQDQLLVDMQVESYIGSALFDRQQKPMGILVGLSRHPLRQPQLAERLIGLFVDRVSAEMQRLQQEERLRLAASVFEYASEGILITDAQARILDVNKAFCRITGYQRHEVLGRNPSLLKSGRQSKDFYNEMWQRLLTDGHWTGDQWNRRKDGQEYVERLTISAIRNSSGEVQRFVGLFSDITPLWEQQSQLEFIAHNDPLTQLPNRVKLATQLQQAMERAQLDDRLLAVAYLDLDGFKAVNDLHGHSAGDRLLVQVASNMTRALRNIDTLARLGGDEFVAVLPSLASQQDCIGIIERLLAAVSGSVCIDGQYLHVSASIGITFYPQPEEVDADQLLRQADQAMYQAKQAGKNRHHLFDAEHDREVRGRHESIEHIRQALEADEFVLHYQPKVNLRTGAVIGVEALIRWQHPENGLIPPIKFLPVIESHQLSVAVGNWVLNEAVRQHCEWLEQGLHLPVSVNINAIHALQPGFVDGIRQLLQGYPQLHPADLELEILETSAFQDLEQMSLIIQQCRELGICFSLDDFGTGYSSLTYLKHLPVQMLKVDQSFIRDMLEDPDDLAILDGILSLANAFQRGVIAEGVETEDHAEMLLQMGCEFGQGYAIARPMPASAVKDWMTEWQVCGHWHSRPAITRRNLPVLYAMVEHRAWSSSLHEYLQGLREEPPALDSHKCRLGCWLIGDGAGLADHPIMPEVMRYHEEAHRKAIELVRQYQSGERMRAQARLPELQRLRDTLLALLQQLID